MSNFLAIATVTASLRQLLQIAVDRQIQGAQVFTLNPTDTKLEQVQGPTVNIFLYQVTPNAALRNADLPTRTAGSQLRNRPQVALDLHYLFSFYGDHEALEPERLLGSVVETLHTQPQLDKTLIQDTISGQSQTFSKLLAVDKIHLESTYSTVLKGSDLADQVERVRFTPTYLSLEELSKVWSVFLHKPYTLSLTYRAEVVLIDADQTPVIPKSVYHRQIDAHPGLPAIAPDDSVEPSHGSPKREH